MKKILSRVLWIQIREGKVKGRNLYSSDASRKMPFLPSFDNYHHIWAKHRSRHAQILQLHLLTNLEWKPIIWDYNKPIICFSNLLKWGLLPNYRRRCYNYEVISEGIKTVHYEDNQIAGLLVFWFSKWCQTNILGGRWLCIKTKQKMFISMENICRRNTSHISWQGKNIWRMHTEQHSSFCEGGVWEF